MAGQNEIVAIGLDQAQVMVGGAVGAGLRLYLRPAGSLLRACFTGALCIGSASVFGPTAAKWLAWASINQAGSGAVVALVTLTVAEGVLRAVEKFDFMAFFRRGGAGGV